MEAAQETVRHAIRNITHDLTPEDIDKVLQDREHTGPHLEEIKEKVEQALTRFASSASDAAEDTTDKETGDQRT
jgi:ElaB/YqjD/DUF883 family membrane-anchored ribosome-binding protein